MDNVAFSTTNTLAKSNFISEFLKKENKVGSLAPSSRYLAQKMLRHIPFDTAEVIVELGPGTGAFTPYLLQKMKAGSTLILLELNEVFYKELLDKFNDPRLIILHGSATDLPNYLDQLKIAQVDCILSSLPLAILPPDISNTILDCSKKALKTGGYFIQFQYSWQSRKKIARLYGNLSLGFTPWNFPPAWVYTCRKQN